MLRCVSVRHLISTDNNALTITPVHTYIVHLHTCIQCFHIDSSISYSGESLRKSVLQFNSKAKILQLKCCDYVQISFVPFREEHFAKLKF